MTIDNFVQEYELVLRLSFFFGILLIMAIWEIVAPRRVLTISKVSRWSSNLGIVVLNSIILRLIFPAAAVGIAGIAQKKGLGFLHEFDVSFGIAVIVSVILMDFAIYIQHVMFHAVPLLWRLHRVHHADLDYDVTTGARFHPIEIILSMLIKFAVILLLGAPILAVIIFEIMLNATAMFNHSNIKLPLVLDRWLRFLLVTPDMHRVHHSVEMDEANSNFGFSLPWWDRIFGTYWDQPQKGHQKMIIGIHTFRETKHCANLLGMLLIPFISKVKGYAINHRGIKKSN